jgi:hypothetical protein
VWVQARVLASERVLARASELVRAPVSALVPGLA